MVMYMKKLKEEEEEEDDNEDNNLTENDGNNNDNSDANDGDDDAKKLFCNSRKYSDKNSITYKLFDEDKIAYIIKSPKARGNVYIPKIILSEYKVTKICDYAFANSSIDSLNFPNDSCLKVIGNSAFENSTLSKLQIPQSLIKLDKYWCKGANLLKEIEVDSKNKFFFINKEGFLIYKKSPSFELLFAPHSIEGDYLIPEEVTRIGPYCFSKRQGITSVKSVSSSLEEVRSHSFCQCENLTSLTFQQESQLILGSDCFSGCKSLLKIELLCKSVKFGSSCFTGSTSLREFVIKGGEVKIENKCFEYCTSINSLSFLETEKVYLGDNQFANLKNLEKVVIESKSEVKLGVGCFFGAEKLENIDIDATTVSMSNSCFMNCYSLSTLNIPKAVDLAIGASGFGKCYKLANVKLCASNSLKIGERCFCESGINTCILHAEDISISVDCFKCLQSINSISIAAKILKIENGCFEGCLNLQTVILEAAKNLKIGDNCFSGDKNIKTLDLLGFVIDIGKSCFFNCSSIKSLKFQGSEKVKFDEKSFENCGIEEIELKATDEFQAGSNCFLNSTFLKSVLIASKIVTIKNSCFSNCSSLNSFTILNAENSMLGEKVFENCVALENVNISSKIDLVAESLCFDKTENLKKIEIRSEKIFFGCNCFDNCLLLSKIQSPFACDITCYQNSFNGKYSKEILECPQNTNFKILKIQENPKIF